MPEYDSNELPHDDLPNSPVESYDYSLFPQEDHASEPPALPRMLTAIPLDSLSVHSTLSSEFVRLNHVFESKSASPSPFSGGGVRTIATELRHKSKVITAVLVTPRQRTASLSPSASFRAPSPVAAGSDVHTGSGSAVIPSHGETQALILDALNNV